MYAITETSTIVLTAVLTVLATLAVMARWLQINTIKEGSYQAKNMVLGRHLDDILIVIALVLTYPMSAMLIWGAAVGSVGAHSGPADANLWFTTVTPAWVNLAKVAWVVFWLQPLILGCIKLSIIFFCRRIFGVSRSFNIVSWVMIGLISAWMVAFSIGLFFDCGANIAANWGSLEEIGAQCPFGFLPTIIYTILDACFDLFVLVLPIPWIFKLQMPMSRKLSVSFCFLLGGIATAASFVRMTIYIQTGIPSTATSGVILGLPAYDILGLVSAEMFWTMIETTVALIAVCLPAIRKVVRLASFGDYFRLTSIGRFYRSLIGSNGSRSNGSGSRTQDKKSGTDIELGQAGSRASSRVALHKPGYTVEANAVTDGDREAALKEGTIYRVDAYAYERSDEGLVRQ